MRLEYLFAMALMVAMVLGLFSCIPVLFPAVTCEDVLIDAGYEGYEYMDDGDVCLVLVMTDEESDIDYWIELEKR